MNDDSISKLAIVTGASRGIGRALAMGLAEDGYDLALIARDESALNDVQSTIKRENSGTSVKYHVADVTNDDLVVEVVSAIVDRFGRIDLLINNAGTFRAGTVDVDVAELDTVVATNLRGCFSLLRAVVPIMKGQRDGSIINMSSIAGKSGYAGYGIYAASKFALQGLSESLYKELLEYNVKVTSICPNWVATELAVEAGGTLPAEDMIQLDDIVKTVRWLLSLSQPACLREVVIDCRSNPY